MSVCVCVCTCVCLNSQKWTHNCYLTCSELSLHIHTFHTFTGPLAHVKHTNSWMLSSDLFDQMMKKISLRKVQNIFEVIHIKHITNDTLLSLYQLLLKSIKIFVPLSTDSDCPIPHTEHLLLSHTVRTQLQCLQNVSYPIHKSHKLLSLPLIVYLPPLSYCESGSTVFTLKCRTPAVSVQ